MDFSSQLANLQRSAANAASQQQQQRQQHSPHGERDRNQRYDDSRRYPAASHSSQGRKRQRRSGRHDWNEHALQRSLATLPHLRLPNADASTSPDPPRPPHLALLVLSIDDLPYEHLWRAWAAETDKTANLQVSVLCHAKFPQRVTSLWLKQRLLVEPPVMGRGHEFQPPTYHSRRPEWGSIGITRAMLDLLHEGLKIGVSSGDCETDPRFSTRRYAMTRNTPEDIMQSPLAPIDKFLFVSETCIPVATLKQVQETLFGSSPLSSQQQQQPQQFVSWVNARNTPNNGYSKQLQFDKIHPVVPSGCRWKADQWMVLSRIHASAIMDVDRHLPREHFLWQCFQDTKASDELYFPTALGLLGLLPAAPDSPNATVKVRRVTYADWSVSARNPASFAKGVQDLKKVAELARREGCLLARKFVPSEGPGSGGEKKLEGDTTTTVKEPGYISVDEWKSIIHAMADEISDETKEEA